MPFAQTCIQSSRHAWLLPVRPSWGPRILQAQLAHSYQAGREELQYLPHAPGNVPQANGGSRASPPWRDDDKDGHYTFELGENLTPRCEYYLCSAPYACSVKFPLGVWGLPLISTSMK